MPTTETMLECAVCGHNASTFKSVGRLPRSNAECPACGAYERHRLIAWYLKKQKLVTQGLALLDVAPTPCLGRFLDEAGAVTTSVDLGTRAAQLKMDIEEMSFADDSFDAILCVHVLEHVTDDHRALRELYRVLRPGGWAILMVPISEQRPLTDEDLTIVDPQERERRFGQWDHVRLYGADYRHRCEAAGFRMQIFSNDIDEVAKRHAFLPNEKLYIGWKEQG